MLEQPLPFHEVVRAGTLLFGASFVGVVAERSWRDELKRTFRRRILEAHPDRAAVLGRPEHELLEEFHALQRAYELLEKLGDLPVAPPRAAPARSSPPRPASGSRAWSERPAAARATAEAPGEVRRDPSHSAGVHARATRRGPIVVPARRLRLAEYLFHLGVVRSSDVGAAIAWQRAQRPPVGRIAERFGYLAPRDVAQILRERLHARATHEPFATFAVEAGWLTPFQRLALLGQQRRLQQPIGRWFVERDLLTEEQLAAYCARLRAHNARHAA